MKANQIVELALKLFALFSLVYALHQSFLHMGVWFVVSDFDDAINQTIITAALASIVPFLTAIVLFLNAKSWSTKIIQIDSKEETKLSSEEFHFILVSVLGMFIVVSTIIPVASYIVSLIKFTLSGGLATESITLFKLIPVFAYIVVMMIGTYFMFGAKGIVSLIRKLRYAGS